MVYEICEKCLKEVLSNKKIIELCKYCNISYATELFIHLNKKSKVIQEIQEKK